MFIYFTIPKIDINNFAYEKTTKQIENSALKVKKRNRKLINLLYCSKAEVIMDDEMCIIQTTINSVPMMNS